MVTDIQGTNEKGAPLEKGNEKDKYTYNNSSLDLSSLPHTQVVNSLVNEDFQLKQFLEIFKKLDVNLLFEELIAQSPKYLRFLKDRLANKEKLQNMEKVCLNAECSPILQDKMPPKLKDPGSFPISCLIRG